MNEPTWAIVELMGHVRLAGKLSEEEHFGAKMGRLDVPRPPQQNCIACHGTGEVEPGQKCLFAECNAFVTQFFGGSSVYRITPVTEEVARAVARRSQPEPVHSWEMPRAALPAPTGRVDDEPDFDEFGG